MRTYVTVGNIVVGTFYNQMAALKFCVKRVAPGTNPKIKKCPEHNEVNRAKDRSNEARHTTSQLGSYKRVPPLLRPGDFTL